MLLITFLFVPAVYDIKSGPQLAMQGPKPNDSPSKNELSIIFVIKNYFSEKTSAVKI